MRGGVDASISPFFFHLDKSCKWNRFGPSDIDSGSGSRTLVCDGSSGKIERQVQLQPLFDCLLQSRCAHHFLHEEQELDFLCLTGRKEANNNPQLAVRRMHFPFRVHNEPSREGKVSERVEGGVGGGGGR